MLFRSPLPSFPDSGCRHKAGFLSLVETLGLWQAVIYWILRSMVGCLRKRRWKFAPFSGYGMKNKFRIQDQLLYANRVWHATTPGSHHAEKTSFVSTNAIPEREGGGPGHWIGRCIAELSIYCDPQLPESNFQTRSRRFLRKKGKATSTLFLFCIYFVFTNGNKIPVSKSSAEEALCSSLIKRSMPGPEI